MGPKWPKSATHAYVNEGGTLVLNDHAGSGGVLDGELRLPLGARHPPDRPPEMLPAQRLH